MNHQGHGLALKHPVFNRPNDIDFPSTSAERQTNHEGYTSPLYPNGMAETYSLVDFEIEDPEKPNPTLVSHDGFFTDVPGFENLAEGQSSKMLGSLALARQGSYFYWGYSIDPKELTQPAQATFANAIHYMITKRGSKTVPFACRTRRKLSIFLTLYEEVGYKRGIEEHFLNSVQEQSRKTYEPTPEGIKSWLDSNLAFVFSGRGENHRSERVDTIFEVDVEAKELGTPNNLKDSLKRWIELASDTESDQHKTALKLLDRYVHPTIAPANWDQPMDWYNQWHSRIVFVDSAGFWWLEDPSLDEGSSASDPSPLGPAK